MFQSVIELLPETVVKKVTFLSIYLSRKRQLILCAVPKQYVGDHDSSQPLLLCGS